MDLDSTVPSAAAANSAPESTGRDVVDVVKVVKGRRKGAVRKGQNRDKGL